MHIIYDNLLKLSPTSPQGSKVAGEVAGTVIWCPDPTVQVSAAAREAPARVHSARISSTLVPAACPTAPGRHSHV